MTKEQILAAIKQAVEQGEVHDVDTGFVTKIVEQNQQKQLKFWVGTQAQYNLIETPEEDVLYIITNPEFEREFRMSLFNRTKDYLEEYGQTEDGWYWRQYASGFAELWRKSDIQTFSFVQDPNGEYAKQTMNNYLPMELTEITDVSASLVGDDIYGFFAGWSVSEDGNILKTKFMRKPNESASVNGTYSIHIWGLWCPFDTHNALTDLL